MIPTSTSSETRLGLAQRDALRRRARSNGNNHAIDTLPFRRRRSDCSGGGGDGSSSGGGSLAVANNDEFLDDVRFDVAPKDMCVPLGSQDTPGRRRVGDSSDSVVLQELCSLGSVLAAGIHRGEGGAEDNSDRYGDDGSDTNNSRGARDDTLSGGNLLSRWLSSGGNSNQGSNSACEKTEQEGGEDAIVGSCSLVDASDGQGGGSGGNVATGGGGSRIVGDWARRALLRKKMADAERGRRIRLQLEDEALVAATTTASNASDGCGDGSCGAGKDAEGAAGCPPASFQPSAERSLAVGDSLEEKNHLPKLSQTQKKAPAQASMVPALSTSLELTPATSTGTADGIVTNKNGDSCVSREGAEGGTDQAVVIAVDDYGDDEYGDCFSFLTCAELQAIEEETAKAYALSQSASQASTQPTTMTVAVKSEFCAPGLPTYVGTNQINTHSNVGAKNAGEGGSWRGGGPAVTTTDEADEADEEAPIVGVKRPAGFRTSPSLMAVGPNAKRGGYRPHPRGGPTPSSTTQPANISRGSGSFSSSQPGREHSQGHSKEYSRGHGQGNSVSAQGNGRSPGGDLARNEHHHHWQDNDNSQARAVSGRGVSPVASVEISRGGWVGSDAAAKAATGGSGGASRPREKSVVGGIVDLTAGPYAVPGGDGKDATGATSSYHSSENSKKSHLFTTYGSIDEFARSTARGGGKVGRGGGVPEKGQTRLTDWGQQQQQHQHSLPTNRQSGAQQWSAAPTVVAPAAVTEVFQSGTVDTEAPVKSVLGSGRSAPFFPALVHRRFVVLEVTYVSAQVAGSRTREKVLVTIEQHPRVASTGDGNAYSTGGSASDKLETAAQQRKISLQGDWFDCEVKPGEVVHVIFPVGEGVSDREVEEMLTSAHVVVNNGSGRFLVVHPDVLVSPTKVADTVLCNRKAVLQSRLASDASKSKPAVLGNLKHELFETSLLAAAAAAAASTAGSAGASGADRKSHLTPAPMLQQGTYPHTETSNVKPGQGQRSPAAVAASTWQNQSQQSRLRPAHSRGGGEGVTQPLLTSQYMTDLVDKIVVSQLEALYGARLDEDSARRELLAVSGPILNWHRSFLSPATTAAARTSLSNAAIPNYHPHNRSNSQAGVADGSSGPVNHTYKNGAGDARRGQQNGWGGHRAPAACATGGTQRPGGFVSLGPDGKPAARVQVARVLATEDDVWCPVLGMKGIMDATVEATVEPLVTNGGGEGRWQVNGCGAEALVMPVEVKTGKRIGDAHSSHRAQVCVRVCMCFRCDICVSLVGRILLVVE